MFLAIRVAVLAAFATAAMSPADALDVRIPVQIVYVGDSGTARWKASTPNIRDFAPVLNSGDTLTILRIEELERDLGTWKRSYRRFSHETCRRSWFRKKCTRHYATDEFTRTKSFDVPSASVSLTMEFVNALAPEHAWRPGEFPLARFVGKPILAPGPLELSIVGGVESDVPQEMDGAAGDPTGPVQPVHIVGKDAPAVWFYLVVDFTAARIAN